MKRRLALLAITAVACHAPPPAAPSPAVPAPRPVVAPEPTLSLSLPPSVGSLERPAALVRLFESLGHLEAGDATDDVRMLEFGDSHTAADWQTGPVRRQLQARFGDGGRGFVPVGRPWKAWSQEGVLTGTAGEWTTPINNPSVRHATGDGFFGLAGFALASRQPGARAWTDVLAAATSAEIDYLEQPGGGSFDLVVDGKSVGRIATRAEARKSAFRAFELGSAATRHVEVRALGDGEVRVFGVALDREPHGLVFDALGINGARVATAVSWDAAQWADQLRHRAPALVILAYGTNDAADPELSLEAFDAGMTEALSRITHAVPSASCLVLGPPDRANAPRLEQIAFRERAAASAAGCAFFDQLAAMGGAGAMARWATEAYPRGQPDRVHFSRQGYAQLATFFVEDLLKAYDLWRSKTSRTASIESASAADLSSR